MDDNRFPIPRRVWSGIVLVLVLVLGAGFLIPRSDDFFALKKNFTIFGKLYEELTLGYVDPIDAEQLIRTGIDAMLRTLDPYTVFVDEADNEDLNILTQGRYGGVGLSIGRRAGQVVVLRPIEGYSAFEQGIRTGDIITRVDGAAVDELAIEELSQLLRGEPGTTVRLSIDRAGEHAPLEFVLTRSRVQINNVAYSGYVADGVGYARLERFARNAGQELAGVIEQLRDTGELHALVLDLRGNPGGLLEEAVAVSSLFLPANTVVVSTRGRAPETERTYRTQGRPLVPELPLVILIDGGSASASEIVAGALQDHDRAVVLGETTFGKGLVQVIRPLPYNTSLKLTVSKYYVPSGRSIQSIAYSRDHHGARADALADSLRKAFTTTGGRTVYDGIGIEPDEPVSLGVVSELEEALTRQAAFFMYANHFAATRDEVGADFRVTDAELRAFREWLREQDFDFTTRAERAIRDLGETLEEAGYGGAAPQLRALEHTVAQEKEADFERHAPRIRERLRREIVARSLGETDQIRAALRDDVQLERAMQLLADPRAYGAILASN